MATHDVLHGIGVSAGTAAAPAAIVQPAPGVDTTEPGSVMVARLVDWNARSPIVASWDGCALSSWKVISFKS